jgi:cbb3-type cytochrome oxidase maturation protein
MHIPLAALLVVVVALFAAALALAAFLWAVRTKQFSIHDLNKGAYTIFDDDEPVGLPQDMVFKKNNGYSSNQNN